MIDFDKLRAAVEAGAELSREQQIALIDLANLGTDFHDSTNEQDALFSEYVDGDLCELTHEQIEELRIAARNAPGADCNISPKLTPKGTGALNFVSIGGGLPVNVGDSIISDNIKITRKE